MTTSTNSQRLTGTVKWFNNKAGFGFITVCDEGEFCTKDIFVHYSSLRKSTEDDNYKYLVQGEYVEFTLSTASKGDHEFQAIDVTGVKGGPIMCVARRSEPQLKKQRSDGSREARSSDPESVIPKVESNVDTYAKRVGRPATDADGFVAVQKRTSKPKQGTKPVPVVSK